MSHFKTTIKALFIILSLATLGGFLIEVYTFRHFLFKHFFISTEMLAVFSIAAGLFVLNSKSKVKRNIDYLVNIILHTNLYMVVPLTIAYFYLTYLNQINFPNFVFSKYHLQPILLIRPIVFSVCFLIILYIKRRLPTILTNLTSITTKKSKTEVYLVFALILLLATYFINNFLIDVSTLSPYIGATIKNIRSSSAERYDYMMNMKYGTYYDYVKFVISVTEDNSSILLPPQKNPWQYEGNQRLTRFFLYPRTLYSAHEPNLPEYTDYVLITWGRPEFPPAGGDNYGWPNYSINAKEVLIFDSKTKDIKVYTENYDPNKFLKGGVYGIIKTK